MSIPIVSGTCASKNQNRAYRKVIDDQEARDLH